MRIKDIFHNKYITKEVSMNNFNTKSSKELKRIEEEKENRRNERMNHMLIFMSRIPSIERSRK